MQSQTQREDDVKTHRDNTMWREGELQLYLSCQGTCGATGRWTRRGAILSGPVRASYTRPTPWFQTSASELGDNKFLWFRPRSSWSLFQHPYRTNRPSKSTLKPVLMLRVGSKMIDFRRKWGARVGTHKLLGQSFETSRAVCTPIRQLSPWHSLPFDLKPRQDGMPEFTCPAVSCPSLLRLV